MGILRRRKWLEIAALACAALCLCQQAAGAEEKPLQLYEQKIKAGLVYNFLKYTTWPQESVSKEKGKLRVCLFGDDPFDGFLSPLDGRTAQQSLIVLIHIGQTSEAGNCSIVIVGHDEEDNLSGLLQFLQNKHVLTVSDIRHFAAQGGMVEMTKEGEKINLYINKEAVTHAGLGIEDRLLRLAKIVSG